MRPLRLLVPLALLPMLASCGTIGAPAVQLTPPAPTHSTPIQTGTTAIDPLCLSLRVVDLSRFDTDGTKEQVIANNAVLAKICGKAI